MIGLRFTAFVSFFSDVLDAARRGAQQTAKKAGGAIADAARGSIQISEQPSQPGQPPHSATGKLPASIGVEEFGEGVVVGPALLSADGQTRDAMPLPGLLEAGGVEEVTEVFVRGRWIATDRPTPGLKARTRTRRVEARPFMGPALAEVGPRLPGFWADSVSS